MTVVIGVVLGGSLAFCSDQQVAYGPQRELCERKWERVGDVMVGWSGTGLSQQWIWDRMPTLLDEGLSGCSVAVALLASDWRRWMTERKAVDEDGNVAGRLLLGIEGRLWVVDGEGHCRCSASPYTAIGVGASAAGAAALALITAGASSDAEDIAWRAVTAAVETCADLYGVAKPEVV